MGDHRTYFAQTQAAAVSISGAKAHWRPPGPSRDSVRSHHRDSVGVPSEGVRVRQRHDVLATTARLAQSRSVGQATSSPAQPPSRSRQDRLVARGGRFNFGASRFWGAQTGPNPTDRRKSGSKHHVTTDANGIPLVVKLTAANRHDVTQLMPLVDDIPPIAGKAGRPRQRPDQVQGDRAYDSEPHRRQLRRRGIKPILAQRNTEHGSGLGVFRWVVERTISWLHQYRRLRVRYERRPDIHNAFLILGCTLICFKCLIGSFC
jgi:transposase